MAKKPVWILWNVLGTLAALVFPTMVNVLEYVFPSTRQRAWGLFLLDVLLLILLIAVPLLAMRKKLRFHLLPLYVSVVGFLISARMTPIVLPLFREHTRYGGWFGGAAMTTFLHEVLFAIPFACVALLAAILLTLKYRKKKRAEEPVRDPKEPKFSAKRKPSEWLNKPHT